MAATFNWCEDNGAQTGSPLHGTTRSQNSTPPTDVSWKNTDDAKTGSGGTLYSASPVVAGTNSFTKFQYGQFSGSFNQILNCKWSAHTSPAGALATGLTLKGVVTSTYATPSITTNAYFDEPTFTTAVAIGSGSAVNFATSGPENAFADFNVERIGFHTVSRNTAVRRLLRGCCQRAWLRSRQPFVICDEN